MEDSGGNGAGAAVGLQRKVDGAVGQGQLCRCHRRIRTGGAGRVRFLSLTENASLPHSPGLLPSLCIAVLLLEYLNKEYFFISVDWHSKWVYALVH